VVGHAKELGAEKKGGHFGVHLKLP
jgi:hypothetical protein